MAIGIDDDAESAALVIFGIRHEMAALFPIELAPPPRVPPRVTMHSHYAGMLVRPDGADHHPVLRMAFVEEALGRVDEFRSEKNCLFPRKICCDS